MDLKIDGAERIDARLPLAEMLGDTRDLDQKIP